MRMSCNGCRVLRKGCSEDCSLRPSLQWLHSPESQANATSFLAKFYGRAGLINLLNAAATHLRPEIFKSLLYEACGRIINPVQGSVGLMHSGDWWRCQAALEAVLAGVPLINQVFSDNDSSSIVSGGHIRHQDFAVSLNRVRTRNRVKRAVSANKSQVDSSVTDDMMESEAKFTITGWNCSHDHGNELKRGPSHDSFSAEMVEASLVNGALTGDKYSEIGLELTLGINPLLHSYLSTVIEISDDD